MNVHYLIADPVFETAYRSDVRRVETKDKMAIRPIEHFSREEEFVNVTTSFREAVTVMLVKKFETFFTFKLQDQEEH